MEVLGKDLVDGVFYHALVGHLDFDDVWYSNGRSLINPRNKYHGHCIDVVWAYSPLTIEEVDAFTNWMSRNGDEAGIKAWNKYKEKLIKEAEMAKNNDVDLYNPKFVHFDWDESLKGKKVFYSNSIHNLKTFVRSNNEARYSEMTDRSRDPSWPFLIDQDYRMFAYYDPNYEVKWAYFKEGKSIQIRRKGSEWFDVLGHYDPEFFDDNSFDDERFEFRIKPEEPTDNIEVDVKIQVQPSVDKINIVVNGKACTFENVEDARKVLGLDMKE